MAISIAKSTKLAIIIQSCELDNEQIDKVAKECTRLIKENLID